MWFTKHVQAWLDNQHYLYTFLANNFSLQFSCIYPRMSHNWDQIGKDLYNKSLFFVDKFSLQFKLHNTYTKVPWDWELLDKDLTISVQGHVGTDQDVASCHVRDNPICVMTISRWAWAWHGSICAAASQVYYHRDMTYMVLQ